MTTTYHPKPTEPKTCRKCLTRKSASNFYASQGAKDGLQSWCKECQIKNVYEWRAKYSHEQPSRQAKYQLKVDYGITFDDKMRMIGKQGGKCGVCEQELVPHAHVDHDHTTGKIRAILCPKCNTMLGQARDDPTILRRGAEYLEKYKKDPSNG